MTPVHNCQATPIPRTLSLVSYGDMALSVINELPPGRSPITTRVLFDQAGPREEVRVFRNAGVVHAPALSSFAFALDDIMQSHKVWRFVRACLYSMLQVQSVLELCLLYADV